MTKPLNNDKITSAWPRGQEVKTSPFHGEIMGSIPVGVTKQVKGEPVSIRRRIRLYRMVYVKTLKAEITIILSAFFVLCYRHSINLTLLSLVSESDRDYMVSITLTN